MAEPTRSRPQFPPGYIENAHEKQLVEWSAVRSALESVKIFWLGTVKPNGRPHATPIWGAWVNDTYFWDGSPEARWARNLAANPAIVVHIEHNGMAVMVEGDASFESIDQQTLDALAASYTSRYSYKPEHLDDWYMVRPKRVLAIPGDLREAARFTF
jgi:nitroimidazol reductase NimA-like FMN-containing flavoprotein (pyridoxamine 5'-phosphate oxidase superfamily)